jgi:hypothetical protein
MKAIYLREMLLQLVSLNAVESLAYMELSRTSFFGRFGFGSSVEFVPRASHSDANW